MDTQTDGVGAEDETLAQEALGDMGIYEDQGREDVSASKQARTNESRCLKCGMPVSRSFGGWSHVLPPMSAIERRAYRHVVKVSA